MEDSLNTKSTNFQGHLPLIYKDTYKIRSFFGKISGLFADFAPRQKMTPCCLTCPSVTERGQAGSISSTK